MFLFSNVLDDSYLKKGMENNSLKEVSTVFINKSIFMNSIIKKNNFVLKNIYLFIFHESYYIHF